MNISCIPIEQLGREHSHSASVLLYCRDGKGARWCGVREMCPIDGVSTVA